MEGTRMDFNTSLHELDRHLAQTTTALEQSRELYEQEGLSDDTVRNAMKDVGELFKSLHTTLEQRLASHEGTFAMIRFLNVALRMEYRHIIEYERYADVVQDARLAEALRGLGESERQHAHALSMRILDLGGAPHFSGKHEVREDMTAFDLLTLHYDTERELADFYDSAVGRFDDPSTNWLIGKLKVDEEEHVGIVFKLLETYRDQAIMVEESKKHIWVDPYMGTPGDRAWIE
jgi:bacterioferritin (cytochrome b1)